MRNIIFVGMFLASMGTTAESLHPGLTDAWQFSFGVINQKPDATIRSTAPGDPETEVDLDDQGLDESQTSPQLGVKWRFSNKWTLNFHYTEFGLSTSKTIDTSFNYNGVTYPINASLKTDLDFDLYMTSIEYAIWKSDSTEMGVGVGLHAIDLAFNIKGSLNDVRLVSAGEDFLAPLPNLRVFARHAFSPKLIGSVSAGWLGVEIDKYDGQLIVVSASLDYRVSD